MKRKWKWLVMCCLFLLGFCAIPVFAYSGTNENAQNYSRYSSTIKSYLEECKDGTLMRVQYISDRCVLAEYYDDSYQLIKTMEIPLELPLWGGFHSDGSNYYVVTGQENTEESADVEVYRITKYDTAWNRISSVGLYDCNTTIPFDAGSCRIASEGNYLLIHTSHEMYTSSDGLNHQANVTIQVDTQNMKIADSFTSVSYIGAGYVSHSFNQFIKIDDGKILSLDHGDAYPRSFVICKYPTSISSGSFSTYSVKNVNVMEFPGAIGNNSTGAAAGGFEFSEDYYLMAGHSVVQDDDNLSRSTRNIFIGAVNKNTNEVKIHWVTSYDEGEISTSTPQFVKISNDRFMILWSRGANVYYTECDETGTVTQDIYCIESASLSDCQPIVIDNSIVWYTWNNAQIVFYEIPLDNTAKIQSTICEDGISITRNYCSDNLHTIIKYEYLQETCTTDGHLAYWGCEYCKKGFSDASGTSALYENQYLLKAGHKYEGNEVTNGTMHLICSVCGYETDKIVYSDFDLWWNTDGGNSYSSRITTSFVTGEALYLWLETVPGISETEDDIIIEISNPDICSHIWDSQSDYWGYMGHFSMNKPGTTEITIRSKYNSGVKYTYTLTITCPTDAHDWDSAYTIDVQPTCTASGKKSIHCKNCSETKDSQVVDALGHDLEKQYTYDENYHWNSCLRCNGKYNIASHTGGNATCTEPAICSICQTSYGTSKGHSWQTYYTTDINPTCTVPGSKSIHCSACSATKDSTDISALGHNWKTSISMDETYHWYDCSRCEETKDKSTHSGGNATCTLAAVCSTCHSAYGTAKGHSWDTDFTIDQNATCTEDGRKSIHCSACTEIKNITTIPLLGHDWSSTFSSNQTHHWYDCSRCEEKNLKSVHKGTPLTCTEDSTCVICQLVLKTANGHQWNTTYTIDKEATAESKGEKSIHCSVCNTIKEGSTVYIRYNPFIDVHESSYYYEPVLWAVENKITSGSSPTTFDPDGICNRAQAVTFLWRSQGQPEPDLTSENPFIDVQEGTYYYKAVLWAVENGITSGISKTEFAPDDIVTRGQFVTFLWRTEGKPEPTAYSTFYDVQPEDFYYKAVNWAAENHITTGIAPNCFGSNESCKRGQVVSFLYRAYGK